MLIESTSDAFLGHNPDLPAIATAIEEFKAHKPITQRSAKTGQPMVVEEDQELEVLIVVCDGRVVYRSRAAVHLSHS